MKDKFCDLNQLMVKIQDYRISIENLKLCLLQSFFKNFGIFFKSDEEKKLLNDTIFYTKNSLELMKEKLTFAENFAQVVCTFHSAIVAFYIAFVLGKEEEEDYVVKELDLETATVREYPNQFGNVTTYLIVKESSMEKVHQLFAGIDKATLKDIENVLQGEKYLTLNGYESLVFDYVEGNVPSAFTEQFPYLMYALMNLVNVRIANPFYQQFDIQMKACQEYALSFQSRNRKKPNDKKTNE